MNHQNKIENPEGTLSSYAGFASYDIVGRATWAYLKRMDSSPVQVNGTDAYFFGALAAVSTLISAGISLAKGGMNLKRKAEIEHDFSLAVHNHSPNTLAISSMSRAENGKTGTCVLSPGATETILVSTESFAGNIAGVGPSLNFCLHNGIDSTSVGLQFIDTTDGSSSGVIKVEEVIVNGLGIPGYGSSSNLKIENLVFEYESFTDKPGSVISVNTISNGNGACSVTFL